MAEARKEMIIGTREAAVLSCVNVIAAVTAQREELLAYWLDLYYQVRLAYEREVHPEQFAAAPAPVLPVMRPEDVYSAVRQIWGERIAAAPAGPRNDEEDGQTCAEILGPQIGVKGWAAKKAAIRERLIAARNQGVTAAQLVTASEQSEQKISDAEIYAILNAEKVDMGTYRRLEAALEALGR